MYIYIYIPNLEEDEEHMTQPVEAVMAMDTEDNNHSGCSRCTGQESKRE